MRSRTQVGIVGAGPAGLFLSHLLHLAGIESIVVENRSRDYVEHRVRAGVLEQGTVDLMRETGLAARLDVEGLVHHGIEIRFGGQGHRIPMSDLAGGRAITIYGQQEVVKDLIAARLAAGGDVRFEAEEVQVSGIDGDKPAIQYLQDEEDAHRGVRLHRRMRWLPWRYQECHSTQLADRVSPRVPVCLASDPCRRRAVDRRADLRPPRPWLCPAQPPIAVDQPPLHPG